MTGTFKPSGFARRATAALLFVLCSSCQVEPKIGHWQSGLKHSDPQPTGKLISGWDRLIVPGVRIGPVVLGGLVQDAVNRLGKPDKAERFKWGDPSHPRADEVTYTYETECIVFHFLDKGLAPKIGEWPGAVSATCKKWATAAGLRVGQPMRDLADEIGAYCAHTDQFGLLLETKGGVFFRGKDRNSLVTSVWVGTAGQGWTCKD